MSNIEKLPHTFSSGVITEEQLRTKYGKKIHKACMTLEVGDSDFLQNYGAYKKKHRKWVPYYYRGVISQRIKNPDTRCIHVVLLDDNRFQNMKSLLCVRRIGDNQFETLLVDIQFSIASDIKGSLAYIAISEAGNIAFEDCDTSVNKDELADKKKHKKKLDRIRAALIAYALVSCVAAIVLLIATINYEASYSKAIALLICFLYIAILYVIGIIIQIRLGEEAYRYIRRDGIHLLTAVLVLMLGVACIIAK